MTMTDYAVARLWSRPPVGGVVAGGPNGQSAVEHFARHGLSDPQAQEQIRQRAGYYPSLVPDVPTKFRSEEHTSELQSLMRISYAVFCLKKKNNYTNFNTNTSTTQACSRIHYKP